MTQKERFDFYRTKLTSKEGLTSIDLIDFSTDDVDDNVVKAQFRQDIRGLKGLFMKKGIALIEKRITDKFGTSLKHFYLDRDVDINSLWNSQVSRTLSGSLYNFLSHLKIGLPDDVLGALQSGNDSVWQNDGNETVAFEANDFLELNYFADLYNAINCYGLKVEYHLMSDADCQYTVVLYPEFLKQYNNSWYVFGAARDLASGKFLDCNRKLHDEPEVFRLDVELIDSVEQCGAGFVATGVRYKDYFENIIGVDNINREVQEVRLLVKNTMLDRFETNLMHDSFCIYPDEKSPVEGYSVAKMVVKHNKELERKLLSFGSDLIVVSPKKLRDTISKEYQKINDLYSD